LFGDTDDVRHFSTKQLLCLCAYAARNRIHPSRLRILRSPRRAVRTKLSDPHRLLPNDLPAHLPGDRTTEVSRRLPAVLVRHLLPGKHLPPHLDPVILSPHNARPRGPPPLGGVGGIHRLREVRVRTAGRVQVLLGTKAARRPVLVEGCHRRYEPTVRRL
jgi:hypothetical protein